MAGVDTQEWRGRVGKSWAAEWERTDRSFSQLTDELVRRILLLDFSGSLDVGCGAGELSLRLAEERPDCRFVGVDISPDLIEAARARAVGSGNVTFELADAGGWQAQDGWKPDILVSRHGVMFFDDPVAAFSNLRNATATGASLVFSCFRGLEHNPFFAEAGKLVPTDPAAPAPDPQAPGPFAFADPARIAAILTAAGWEDISCEAFDFAMIAGSGANPVDDAVSYFGRIGPAARAMAVMGDDERAAMKAQLADLARRNLRNGTVSLGASAWIVTAGHA